MIMEFEGKYPKIHASAFIAENAMVIGDVEIGPGSNVWFYSIVRGDLNSIRIGANCNIPDDRSCLHARDQVSINPNGCPCSRNEYGINYQIGFND
jgi:carbonic anhydrase/acetyltransferase-like protein (isoleucine patch superfamily)